MKAVPGRVLDASVRGADRLQLGLSENLGARLSLFRRRHRGRVGEEPLLFGPAEHGAHPSMVAALRRVGELILVDERADVTGTETARLQVGPGFARKVFEDGPVGRCGLLRPAAGLTALAGLALCLYVQICQFLERRVLPRLEN